MCLLAARTPIKTKLTAKLLTGQYPRIDQRASYATAPPGMSAVINALARDRNISFLDAARQYNNPEVLRGIDEQADELFAYYVTYT